MFQFFEDASSSGISPADMPSTTAQIEPSADQVEAANALGAAFISYQRAGFNRREAYGLVQTFLAALLTQR
jgi:hypothetical protein